jgi:hypothetical protein
MATKKEEKEGAETTPTPKSFVESRDRFFVHFFPGKISGKIPRKIFPPKMLGKTGIFRGKSFEKSFFQEISRNFLRKVIFCGK